MFVKRYEDITPTTSKTGKKDAQGNDVAESDQNEPTPEEKRQDMIEKKAAQFKKEEEQRNLELIEYYKFPNIMGWYFDGTFTSNFTLHEEYAEYFNEIEDELDAQKDLIIEETFTEKAYRNFWPPHFFAGGRYFRTRGVYLDFKEVREDPPKTPPNINYEKQRGIIGVEVEIDPNDVQESGLGIRFYSSTYGPSGHQNNRDNWYWNEDKREFKPKDVDGDYIWCDDEKIWREADPTFRTPYDWYFDDHSGRYLTRDRSKPDDYEFDQEKNIYRKKGTKEVKSINGLRFNDYFYDENKRKWMPITKNTTNLTNCVNGHREILIGDRGKSGLITDDFYYDGETGSMEKRDSNNHHDYYYDTRDKMFKKKGQMYGPGKANHFPQDYEFDHILGVFHPRPARECRHIEPYDFYFDMSEGKFHRIEGHQREKYAFDSETNLYKLKDAKGPSANGLGPEDYYWHEDDRQWKLIITVKDPTILEMHEPGKRKILKGERGKTDKVPDDWYYDAYDGSFFRKDLRKLENYWFDSIDGVWKKRGQPYGPGFLQLYPEHYYYDYDEGYWLPNTPAQILLSKRKRGEVKGLSDLTPYDFSFNDSEGEFNLRDKSNPGAFRYNMTTGVFHKDGARGPPPNGKHPKDYFFDELTCTWLPIEHPKGHEAKDYKNGRRNNRVGPRGTSGKIMDDYYFKFSTGDFHLKSAEEQYEYLPDQGVWKASSEAPPSNLPPSVPNPKEYYFDKEEGEFILKKSLKYGEIVLNQNVNLWMQRWRRPVDYYWEPRQNKYLRKPASMIADEKANAAAAAIAAGADGKAGGVIGADGKFVTNEQLRKEKEKRDYERPWLHNYMFLAADEIRFEQELKKKTKLDKDKGKKGGKKFNTDAKSVTPSKAQPNINETEANKEGSAMAPSDAAAPSVAPSEDSIVSKGSKRKKKA